MNKPSTDVVRRVFDEGGRYFLEIGPWPDSPDCVELRTIAGEFSAEYYGQINISLTPALAAELGRALIAAADLNA
jgi:hypothetical protein